MIHSIDREFKAEHVNALLDNLEQQGKFKTVYEEEIWRRALRIAAFLHFDLYTAVERRAADRICSAPRFPLSLPAPQENP